MSPPWKQSFGFHLCISVIHQRATAFHLIPFSCSSLVFSLPELNIKPEHASDIPASDYEGCLKRRAGTHCLNHILHSVYEKIMVNKDDTI